MIKKCPGCGAVFQYKEPNEPGYVELETKETAKICKRCFRIKNYGDYTFVKKSDDEYYNMLAKINASNDLVLYLVDVFNIDSDIANVLKKINNPVILVLTKRDLLPRMVNEQKVMGWFRSQNLNFQEIILISSEKNYEMDRIYQLIRKHKTSEKVYIIGKTNAGKSTFINQMIKNYSFNKCDITTSNLPATTLEQLAIHLDKELILIDTPGLFAENNIINVVDSMLIKRVVPRAEIKPRIYVLKPEQTLLIEDLVRLDYLKGTTTNYILYLSNDLTVEKINTITNNRNYRLKHHRLEVTGKEDIVIAGLGWIKIMAPGQVNLYVRDQVLVFKRDQLL